VLWFTLIVNPFEKIMAPVVQIEPNGPQTLLIHDDVTDKLTQVGWLVFIQSFKGFNLEVAREFSKTFDGTRVKVEMSSSRLMRSLFLKLLVFLFQGINGLKT
jgi:hypothetical protein